MKTKSAACCQEFIDALAAMTPEQLKAAEEMILGYLAEAKKIHARAKIYLIKDYKPRPKGERETETMA